jgi:hydrogenase expression/formation protein HypC
MRVIAIDGTDAVAEIDGVRRQASLMLMDEEVRMGDYVIIHAGFAISRLDEEDARQTLDLLREALQGEEL